MTDQFIVLAHTLPDANGAPDRDATDWVIHHGKDAYGWAVHHARVFRSRGYQYVVIRPVGDVIAQVVDGDVVAVGEAS